MFSVLPPTYFVEKCLENNEGDMQSLENFPMLRPIYNSLPSRLLLKCSRKTLKSTLLSNFICLNLIRWNKYKMLYVGPQELSTKYFSAHYVAARFESPRIKKIITKGWRKNDVFEKTLADTESSLILRYVSDDATRCRGPATDQNIHDEVQDIAFDQLPIIAETMAMSKFKREIFAGTPLTTDNTINAMWLRSNQLEWAMRCEGCGRWNTLTEDNDPIAMIKPVGLCCSKCEKKINSRNGEWVAFNPAAYNPASIEQQKAELKEGEEIKVAENLVGYHLAQPLLPHFNEDPNEWRKFYVKVHNGSYTMAQVMNESLGLAYDIGTKPITEVELRKLCMLGPQYSKDAPNVLKILKENKYKYRYYASGTDWGVNNDTSRTANVTAAMRDDGIIEVFFAKIFTSFDYESHIREIAKIANPVAAFCASDSGPDPIRGIKLVEYTSPTRSQLVRYEHGRVIQRYEIPPNAFDWRQNRWCLHRSDTMSLVFRLLKSGRILFPQWEEMSDYMRDILNVYIEVKEGQYRQELFYRHDADKPDDFMHALNFCVCQLLMASNDPLLLGPSTSSEGYMG